MSILLAPARPGRRLPDSSRCAVRQAELCALVDSGGYRLECPERTALPAVAWLLRAVTGLGHVAAGGRCTDGRTPAGGRRLRGWTNTDRSGRTT